MDGNFRLDVVLIRHTGGGSHLLAIRKVRACLAKHLEKKSQCPSDVHREILAIAVFGLISTEERPLWEAKVVLGASWANRRTSGLSL